MKLTRMQDWVDDWGRIGLAHTAASTKASYLEAAKPFAAWYDATRRAPRHVCRDDIVAWLLDATIPTGPANPANKLNNSTRNQYRWRIRGFLQWCMTDGRLKTQLSLLDCVKSLPEQPKAFRYLDAEELARVLASPPDPRDRAMLTTFAHTLDRTSEIRAMKVRDVNFKNSTILGWNKKKNRHMEKPMTPGLEKALREWLTFYSTAPVRLANKDLPQSEWYLFPRANAGQGRERLYLPDLSVHSIGRVIKRYTTPVMGELVGEGAGHTLRRSAARVLRTQVAKQYDPATARTVTQTMLDHADGKETDRYTGLSVEKDLTVGVMQVDFLPTLPTQIGGHRGIVA